MLRLEFLRKDKGLNQLELAFHSRVQPADISRIERGRLIPYRPALLRIARVLGVPASDVDSLLLPIESKEGK